MQGLLRRSRPGDVHYKGDWMRRPVGSNEIGLLVRLLLLLSDRINHALYLDGRELPPADDSSTLRVRPACSAAAALLMHAAVLCIGHA